MSTPVSFNKIPTPFVTDSVTQYGMAKTSKGPLESRMDYKVFPVATS